MQKLLFFALFTISIRNGDSATLPTYENLYNEAKQFFDWSSETRRKLHMKPETRYTETATSSELREILRSIGVKFTTDWANNTITKTGIDAPGRTGIVADIGTGRSPCVLLRTDMDGLPIFEENDIGYKSMHEGRMHACGHDAHMTMLLGAARLLKQHESSIKGTIRLMFQPAEEGGAGAKLMIDEGVLSMSPPVDAAFGFHVDPRYPTGSIVSRSEEFMAATDDFNIIINGKSGHAAIFLNAIDPVPAAAAIVSALHTIRSRETYIGKENIGIVSPTTINAGNTNNVIPDYAVIQGTIRALTEDMLTHLRNRVNETAYYIAKAYGCTITMRTIRIPYPPVYNDPELFKWTKNVARDASWFNKVEEVSPVMGGEDFSFIARDVPSNFIFLGTKDTTTNETAQKTGYSLHNSKFQLDERVLSLGSALHAHLAIQKLQDLSKASREEL